jgi:hypothetical protein
MPVFLEPDLSFPVVLDFDKDKPKDVQPTFFAKSQSMRGQQNILATIDMLTEDKDATVDQLFTRIVDTLSEVLVGWSNMSGHEFSKDAMKDVLSFSEARELLRKVAFNQHVTTDEKKSSE